jgi:hypothetical protein
MVAAQGWFFCTRCERVAVPPEPSPQIDVAAASVYRL